MSDFFGEGGAEAFEDDGADNQDQDCFGGGYAPTPMLTTRMCSGGSLNAMSASAIAYSVGLFAQYPPSTSSTRSPLSVLTTFGSKNGNAEHDACTASDTFTPKPGEKVPIRPWACSMLVLKIALRSPPKSRRQQ